MSTLRFVPLGSVSTASEYVYVCGLAAHMLLNRLWLNRFLPLVFIIPTLALSVFPEFHCGLVTSALGRGCVKTRNRPLEIVSRPGEFSVKVSCLLEGSYRLLSQSIASRDVFEGDFWGESVAEFSHSLGHKRQFDALTIASASRPCR